MAATKEIRTKIQSVKSTQKITRAMEMVAASKMRKAQERMYASRPYAQKIRNVMGHLARSHPEYRHPYLNARPFKKVGFMIVTSDRGLCGGLNVNLLKTAVHAMHDWHQQHVAIDLCLIGSKAENFFKRHGGHVVAKASHLGDSPSVNDLIGTVKVMLDAYDNQQLDGLFIVYNEFVSSMVQKPQVVQLLPIIPATDEQLGQHWDYIYEPDAKILLDLLLKRYIESQVYQGVVENLACQHAAQMLAMKNATDNAAELIKDLQLIYNKARQSAITQELAEIVAGADAV